MGDHLPGFIAMSFDERRGGPARATSSQSDEDEAPTTVVSQDLEVVAEPQATQEPADEGKPAPKPRTSRSRAKRPKADDTAA